MTLIKNIYSIGETVYWLSGNLPGNFHLASGTVYKIALNKESESLNYYVMIETSPGTITFQYENDLFPTPELCKLNAINKIKALTI